MLPRLLYLTIFTTLVSAHGRVDVITGDLGGNTTGLGILGGVVPLTGSNQRTEIDSTVFKTLPPLSDGLGRTINGSDNTIDKLTTAMTLSGNLLPQISLDNGSISGTVHIVTTDGAGPYTAILDPTATGAFSTGIELKVTTQVPGEEGDILPANDRDEKRSVRFHGRFRLSKRAANVNEDYPFAAEIPKGTKCEGNVAGFKNVCLIKIVNPSKAGPFGGVVAVQMSDGKKESGSCK